MNNDQCKCLMAAIVFAALYEREIGSDPFKLVDTAVDLAEKIGEHFTTTII